MQRNQPQNSSYTGMANQMNHAIQDLKRATQLNRQKLANGKRNSANPSSYRYNNNNNSAVNTSANFQESGKREEYYYPANQPLSQKKVMQQRSSSNGNRPRKSGDSRSFASSVPRNSMQIQRPANNYMPNSNTSYYDNQQQDSVLQLQHSNSSISRQSFYDSKSQMNNSNINSANKSPLRQSQPFEFNSSAKAAPNAYLGQKIMMMMNDGQKPKILMTNNGVKIQQSGVNKSFDNHRFTSPMASHQNIAYKFLRQQHPAQQKSQSNQNSSKHSQQKQANNGGNNNNNNIHRQRIQAMNKYIPPSASNIANNSVNNNGKKLSNGSAGKSKQNYVVDAKLAFNQDNRQVKQQNLNIKNSQNISNNTQRYLSKRAEELEKIYDPARQPISPLNGNNNQLIGSANINNQRSVAGGVSSILPDTNTSSTTMPLSLQPYAQNSLGALQKSGMQKTTSPTNRVKTDNSVIPTKQTNSRIFGGGSAIIHQSSKDTTMLTNKLSLDVANKNGVDDSMMMKMMLMNSSSNAENNHNQFVLNPFTTRNINTTIALLSATESQSLQDLHCIHVAFQQRSRYLINRLDSKKRIGKIRLSNGGDQIQQKEQPQMETKIDSELLIRNNGQDNAANVKSQLLQNYEEEIQIQ